ncbi:hypothetical protein N480_01295 [Pseudoalteromonas luteoviolacea S2607]|nr:hypothetical protein N480_01295 [Pseudoalteromonas luteoviolacea S2607]
MLPLCDKPVLQVMLERLEKWKEQIIIATTNDGSEEPIIELCKTLKIKYFKGDTNDVLGRYYHACKAYNATASTAVVRLTSDCPIIDPDLLEKVINTYMTNHYSMVNLGPHSGFPRGLDCCIFPFSLLELTHLNAKSYSDREHVTLGMPKFQNLTTYSISALEDLSQIRLTLDEPDDYKAIKAVYQIFDNQTAFTYEELIEALKSNPSLVDINKHVEQKSV